MCVGEAIILGFQHYFTMLGMIVLIPSLVILNINGHSVCSSGETLTDRHRKERFRKISIFLLYFFAMKCASRSSFLLLLCCGLFCADTVVRLFVVVLVVFSLSVLFVAE